MEEFNIKENFKDIVNVYFYFKRNSKLLYRVSLDKFSSFREFSTKQTRLLMYKYYTLLYKILTIKSGCCLSLVWICRLKVRLVDY